MSWHFSRALVAAFSAANSSGGAPSAPSRSNPEPAPSSPPGRMTAASRRSPYGTMFAPLTDDRGEALLTWFREASRARTSPWLEKGTVSMGLAAGSGVRWPASLAKWDPASSSWRTHQLSLLAAEFESLETLPAWGMTAAGELYPLPTPSGLMELRASITSVSGSGLSERVPTPWASPNENRQTKLTPSQIAGRHGMSLCAYVNSTPLRVPTPCAMEPVKNLERHDAKRALPRSQRGGGNGENLATFISRTQRAPTPTAGDAKSSGSRNLEGSKAHAGVSLTDFVRHGNSTTPRRMPTPTAQDAKNNGPASQMERNTKPLNAEVGGPLNPSWVEWLMGWPIGWTDLSASATDSFRKWCASHGIS